MPRRPSPRATMVVARARTPSGVQECQARRPPLVLAPRGQLLPPALARARLSAAAHARAMGLHPASCDRLHDQGLPLARELHLESGSCCSLAGAYVRVHAPSTPRVSSRRIHDGARAPPYRGGAGMPELPHRSGRPGVCVRRQLLDLSDAHHVAATRPSGRQLPALSNRARASEAGTQGKRRYVSTSRADDKN